MSDESADESTLAAPGDSKPCPACGEAIKAAARKCRFCGEDVHAYEVARSLETERDVFVGKPAIVTSVGEWALVVLTVGIAWLVYWVRAQSVTFHVTTQRILVERGLFSKTRDSVELFRIDHFDLHKPLGMRLVGHCRLHLRSSDTSFPSVSLYGIPDLEKLADTLRECSLRERKRRAVTTFVNA